MHINVNAGHTTSAPGASYYLDEVAENRPVRDAVKKELARRGYSVSDSTSPDWYNQNQDLAYQVMKVNSSGCDLAFSIHFNASNITSGTRGVEAYYYGGDKAGYAVAAHVSSNLSKLFGLQDRGAKDGSHLYFTRMTNPTAVLVEVCFVDAEGDADAYNTKSYEEIANAIVDGIERKNYEPSVEEEDMNLNDRITDGYIMDGTTYATVGNCLYWAESNGEKTLALVRQLTAQVTALAGAVEALSSAHGANPNEIAAAVSKAVEEKLEKIDLEVKVNE